MISALHILSSTWPELGLSFEFLVLFQFEKYLKIFDISTRNSCLPKVRRSSGLCLILWIGLTCWVLTIFSMSFYYYIKIPVFSLKCTSANLRIYFQTKISCQKSREIVGRFINFCGKAQLNRKRKQYQIILNKSSKPSRLNQSITTKVCRTLGLCLNL